MRTTLRTRIRLCVESSIQRILILTEAIIAHLEFLHRGIGAVVWQCFNDCEAGTAIRAIREGIQMAPIQRAKNLAETIWASSNVGENERSLLPCSIAVSNLKSCVSDRIKNRKLKTLDERMIWFLFFNP